MPLYALGDLAPDIHTDAFVHPEAVIIGRVTIGAESSIWPGAVLRGDGDAGIIIGERTSIQDNAVLHTTHEQATTVGNDCVVGHLAHLEGCIIEDGSLVGSGSIVLHRAVVHSGALVGAAAVVPNDFVVPSGAMALGVPARLRLDCVDPEMISQGAGEYVKYGRRYREGLRRIG